MSCAYMSLKQYARKIGACDRHWTAAFRKHVFPRFARPVAGSFRTSSSSSSFEPRTRLREDTAPFSKEGLSSSSSDNDTSSTSTSSLFNRSLASHSSHLLLYSSKRTFTPRDSETAMTLPLRHLSVWSRAETRSPTTYRDDARGQAPSIFVSRRYVLPASSTSSHLDEGVNRRQPVGDGAYNREVLPERRFAKVCTVSFRSALLAVNAFRGLPFSSHSSIKTETGYRSRAPSSCNRRGKRGPPPYHVSKSRQTASGTHATSILALSEPSRPPSNPEASTSRGRPPDDAPAGFTAKSAPGGGGARFAHPT
mmetsp:Transcript_7877/g.21007  ORF Transcript_7877/g.21007 Transcript_7877/m.21007 type:complete len:309 (-) Transcript_7877:779-1705(-)